MFNHVEIELILWSKIEKVLFPLVKDFLDAAFINDQFSNEIYFDFHQSNNVIRVKVYSDSKRLLKEKIVRESIKQGLCHAGKFLQSNWASIIKKIDFSRGPSFEICPAKTDFFSNGFKELERFLLLYNNLLLMCSL